MFVVMYRRSPQTADFYHFTLFCAEDSKRTKMKHARAKRAEFLFLLGCHGLPSLKMGLVFYWVAMGYPVLKWGWFFFFFLQ